MKERQISVLDANGQMTDAALKRIAELDHVTRLDLGGFSELTAVKGTITSVASSTTKSPARRLMP